MSGKEPAEHPAKVVGRPRARREGRDGRDGRDGREGGEARSGPALSAAHCGAPIRKNAARACRAKGPACSPQNTEASKSNLVRLRAAHL
eukprot:7090698-Pyramimonas_sp.AAC.1